MFHDLPSRILLLQAVLVSGVCCLVYSLSISFYITPEMDEYSLTIVFPFLAFIFINLTIIFFISRPIDKLFGSDSAPAQPVPSDVDLVNRVHYRLTYGLFKLFIGTTVAIHLFSAWLEDEGFGFLTDPDSWSLFINRGALFLLVTIIQGNLFDQYLNRLKIQFGLQQLGVNTPIVSEIKLDTHNNYNIYLSSDFCGCPICCQVIVKGKSTLVPIYELLEAESDSVRSLKESTSKAFEQGLASYFNREFTSAGDFSSQVLGANPDDKAALIYLEQCNTFMKSEPASGWNGAVVIDNK